MTMFQCQIELDGNTPTLHLVGEFDISTAKAISATHAALLAHDASVVDVECSQVTFFDCAALSALIELGMSAKAAGKTIRLRSVPSCMQRVLTLTAPHANLGDSVV